MDHGYIASVRLIGQKAACFTVILPTAPPIGAILVDSDNFYRVVVVEIFAKRIHTHELIAHHNAGIDPTPPASTSGTIYVEEIHPTHRHTGQQCITLT